MTAPPDRNGPRSRASWPAALLALVGCGEVEPPHRPRLLEAPIERVSGDPVSVAPASFAGQRRFAVTGTAPHVYRVRERVPGAARLHFALGLRGNSAAEVPLTVVAREESGERTLLETARRADGERWHRFTLDLSRPPGSGTRSREVELEFRAGTPSDESEPVSVAWSELFVENTASESPNVVVFLIDTLNADHLGCYGYERETSPVIDRLAEEGVLFENAVSAAPWTDPSILAIFTGLWPSDLWNPEPHAATIRKVVPTEAVTLAEAFAERGYYTVAASDHPGISAPRFGRGFDVYHHLFASGGKLDGWRQTPMRQVRDQIVELVSELPDAGVLLYVHLIYPHRPYDPPPRYRDMFGPGRGRIGPDNREGLINLYDAEIRRTDDLLGVILGDLDQAGLLDDSILALLSDHGEGFWEHGLHEHGNSLFNELLRVPFLLRAPGRLPAGVRVDAAVSHVDLLPTLLDLADVPSPSTTRGVSLVPAARDGKELERLLLSEFPHSSIVQGRTLQSTREKLILLDSGDPGARAKYYDLATDPDELNDLVRSPEAAERVRALRGVFPPRVDRAAGERSEFEPSQEMIDSLNALGYE